MEGCYIAGADPELMVCSPAGQLISAIPLIPGTKEKPTKVKCGAIQHDNVMAEFNVDPAATSEEFEHNTRQVLKELVKFVTPNRLLVQASADYPSVALENEEAQIFGCDPDFDGWTLMMNEFDTTKGLQNFRSAGGHFHVGYKDSTKEMLSDPYGKVEVVKMLDIFQGIPSVLLDSDPTSSKRRSLYGKAGAHRPKEYGVEYRALGNFWVQSPALLHLMYELANRAVELTLQGESGKIINSVGEKKIQKIINQSDRGGAGRVVERILHKYLPMELQSLISGLAGRDADLYTAWAL